jgi:lysophospholipase L1-like esterase
MRPTHSSGLRSAGLLIGGIVLVMAGGTLFWIALSKMYGYKYFLAWLAAWTLIGLVWRGLAPPASTGREKTWAQRTSQCYIAAGGILLGALLCETALTLVSPYMSAEKRFVPAPEWRFRLAEGNAYYWQGHLHRFNSKLFRGGEWKLNPDAYRVLVLGDSLTFGYGVGEEQAYPAVIESRLSKTYRVQVFNLGVSGFQSQDIVQLAHRFIPELKPDLVIYGMCLNDFLPSGVVEYQRQRFVHLPAGFSAHTALGTWISKGYDALLMKLGAKEDFYSDILRREQPWSERFKKDMQTLNTFAKDRGLPPVISLVLNQLPDHSQAIQLTALAESDMQSAGLTVVPAQPYIREFQGNHEPLYVSRWEAHPNARAHQMFAQLLVSAILENKRIRRSLDAYRKYGTN